MALESSSGQASFTFRGGNANESAIVFAELLQQDASPPRWLQLTCGHRVSDAAGVAVAKALASNKPLESLVLVCGDSHMGNGTGIALASVLSVSTSLKCLKLACQFTCMGDEAGVVLAQALESSVTLRSFVLHCHGTNMGEDTGLALAAALRTNTRLEVFTMHCGCTTMSDITGVELALALKHGSAGLRSFELISDAMDDDTIAMLVSAMRDNFMIKSLYLDLMTGRCIQVDIELALARNRALPTIWLAVACYAREAARRMELGMPEVAFRRRVFAFLILPRGA